MSDGEPPTEAPVGAVMQLHGLSTTALNCSLGTVLQVDPEPPGRVHIQIPLREKSVAVKPANVRLVLPPDGNLEAVVNLEESLRVAVLCARLPRSSDESGVGMLNDDLLQCIFDEVAVIYDPRSELMITREYVAMLQARESQDPNQVKQEKWQALMTIPDTIAEAAKHEEKNNNRLAASEREKEIAGAFQLCAFRWQKALGKTWPGNEIPVLEKHRHPLLCFIACENDLKSTHTLVRSYGWSLLVDDHEHGGLLANIAVELGLASTILPLMERLGFDLNSSSSCGKSLGHAAANEGNVEILQFLKDRGCDLGACELVNGMSPIFFACQSDRADYDEREFPKVIRFFHEAGYPIDTPVSDATPVELSRLRDDNQRRIRRQSIGGTPLLVAIDRNHLEVARTLIQLGANPHHSYQQIQPSTRLGYLTVGSAFFAAKEGDLEMIDFLSSEAKVNFAAAGESVTMAAVNNKNGRLDVLAKLISLGCKISVNTMHMVIRAPKASVPFLTKVIESGCPVDTRSLLFAASKSPEMLTCLLKAAPASVLDEKIDHGQGQLGTPVCAAVMAGKMDCATLFFEHGADKSTRFGVFDYSLVQTAIGYACDHSPEDFENRSMLKHLIEAGCAVDDMDLNQFTPLYHCLNFGDHKSAKILLDTNECRMFLPHVSAGDFCITGEANWENGTDGLPEGDPIRAQSASAFSVCLTALLDNGFPKDHCVEEESYSMLHLACMKNSVQCFEALLTAGADPYFINDRGLSVALMACELGHWKIIKVMLRHGVDLDHRPPKGLPTSLSVKNRPPEGFTCAHMAHQNGHVKVLEVLGSAGFRLN